MRLAAAVAIVGSVAAVCAGCSATGSRVRADRGPVDGAFHLQGEDRAAFTAFQRAAADAEVAADLLTLIHETDVRGDLPPFVRQLSSCIVSTTARGAREVAALLPHADLVTHRVMPTCRGTVMGTLSCAPSRRF